MHGGGRNSAGILTSECMNKPLYVRVGSVKRGGEENGREDEREIYILKYLHFHLYFTLTIAHI